MKTIASLGIAFSCLFATHAVANEWYPSNDDANDWDQSDYGANGWYSQTENDCCCDQKTFDGFYVGGNVGVISNTAHRNDLDGFLTDNSGWTTIKTGVTGGVQAGYDWQCGNRLLGLVVDWNGTDIHHLLRDDPNNTEDTTVNRIKSDFKWFTTIRGRAGLTVCDALVYVTLGAAVARFDVRWQDLEIFHSTHTRWGWTAGVGTEFLLGSLFGASCGSNWSAGAEVLFLQFANRERTFTSFTESPRVTFGHSDSAWIGRLALNYRFTL